MKNRGTKKRSKQFEIHDRRSLEFLPMPWKQHLELPQRGRIQDGVLLGVFHLLEVFGIE